MTNILGSFTCAVGIMAMQWTERREERNTHILDDTKSARERYIRDAAIDMVTRQGN
jgi:hypothetical protein